MGIFLVATKLILAAILGVVTGIEGEIKNRAADSRTHIIVNVGACLIMFTGTNDIGKFSSDTSRNTARIVGQIISDIGFSGADTIFQKKNVVIGLATAATLWLSATIGLMVGTGYYEGAIIATMIRLVTLISLNRINDLIDKKTIGSYSMISDICNLNQDSFHEFTPKEGVEVKKLDIIDKETDNRFMIEVTFSPNKSYDIDGFFEKLKSEYNFQSVKPIDDKG